MILGLDVGGTHTDAVVIDNNSVVATCKAVTDHQNLLNSMNVALEKVTEGIDKSLITRINLSTTLSTNAIVEDTLEEVGVIISSGPGIDPSVFSIGKSCHIVEGSIDHRGTVVRELDDRELEKAVKKFSKKNLKVFSGITKFSTRNPDSENRIRESLAEMTDFITLGHKLSGQLSFPRRIATAYYNSAVWRIYNRFADAIERSMERLGLDAEINILKADGGTMPLSFSRHIPVESILSGPAASILGILGICTIESDAVLLDIGGTTTDIAVLVEGVPLIEREGISFNGRPTLVRSLETRSIGIGGDSALFVEAGQIRVGPERKGPSMAEGGAWPTLVDAFNYRGLMKLKDVDASRSGIEKLAGEAGIIPEDFAEKSISFAIGAIVDAVNGFIEELNDKPVYTIHDMVEGHQINPAAVYAMGGPAAGFEKILAEAFSLDVVVPANYQVVNAIGAALARTTLEIELFADTGRGELLIPNLDVRKNITSRYSIDEAIDDARRYLYEYASNIDPATREKDVEVIESTAFKMVSGFSSSGYDLRVKCQVKPGVIMRVEQ